MVIDRFQLPKICKEKSPKFLSFLSGKSLSSMSQGFFGFRRESERINIKAALKAHQLLTSPDFDWRHSLWRILTFSITNSRPQQPQSLSAGLASRSRRQPPRQIARQEQEAGQNAFKRSNCLPWLMLFSFMMRWYARRMFLFCVGINNLSVG